MKVLILDHDNSFRDLLILQLGTIPNCTSFDVASIDDAHHKLEQEQFDLLILGSIRLPTEDIGLEFIRCVTDNPEIWTIRVLLISGDSNPDRLETSARKAGISGFLSKREYSLENLKKAVDSVVAS